METIFINTENSKTNEPQKFVLNLSRRLDLRKLNEYVALRKCSIFYTWKNYKNNKLKRIASMWNDEFELPDGSYPVSDIQDYIEYIIEKARNVNNNSSSLCLQQ